MHVEVTNR